MNMKETNFEVNDNELIRIIPVDCQDGYGTLKVLKVISKEEFIACYDKWIKPKMNNG